MEEDALVLGVAGVEVSIGFSGGGCTIEVVVVMLLSGFTGSAG